MKRHLFKSFLLTITLITGLSACNGGSGTEESSDAPVVQATDTVAIPAGLFVSEAPSDAVPLVAAKGSASEGDRVVFEARVGGRVESFVDGRAVFFVTDSSLLSCDQLHGDGCKTPWDYCCEDPTNLRNHMATVQIVDADGRPLKLSLKDEQGLSLLATIVVSGTVDQVDEEGNFVVNADLLHVRES